MSTVNKCSNSECVAPISCHEGNENYKECVFWIKGNSKALVKSPTAKSLKKNLLPWTGEPLMVNDLSQVLMRNIPVTIGIVGKVDAGKTTYLAMLIALLLRGGKLNGWDFAGTKTALGWDQLYHKLKILGNNVDFPDPTPTGYLGLLHLAFRDSHKRLHDVLFTDISGEAFTIWARHREDSNAANARWVYSNSNAFILFIDCDDLISRKNQAKTEIINIAQMLLHDLRGRPVIAVWSKADLKNNIIGAVKDSLAEELSEMFKNYEEMDISNFSTDDPDELVHENNLKVVDWILSKVIKCSGIKFHIDDIATKDTFLNFKGQ